ncbi:MAG: hypothetical protein ACM3TR_16835 [Caulobacteraceae bacterium]
MTEYKGRKDAVRGPSIVLGIIILMVLVIYFLIPKGFFTYFFIVLLLAFVPLTYSGIILKITIDDKKLVVVRPLSRLTVKFEDVALCAVHCLEEGSYLIYAFVKERYKGGYTVKGIRPRLPFDEVVRLASKENENIDFDVNFNRAKKIPVSFVEDGDALKDRFLMEVGKYHVRIMDDKA